MIWHTERAGSVSVRLEVPSKTTVTERCLQCGGEVPEGFGFCGKCGVKLGTSVPLLEKDSRGRRLLENDIAEAVVERLIKWGKVFFGALGLAMAVVTLSFFWWGITSISDAKKAVDGKLTEMKDTAAHQKTEADKVAAAGKDLLEKYQALSTQYDALNKDAEKYRQVNGKIASLQHDMQTINGQISNWYGTLKTELFDTSKSDKVKFTLLTEEEKKNLPSNGNELYWAAVTLKQVPIASSVTVTRFYYVIPANEIYVAGNAVRFITFSNRLSTSSVDADGKPVVPGAPILIQYHAAK